MPPSLIPKKFSFNTLKSRLKGLDIQWQKSRGSGSHGCFVGPDSSGKRQVYAIPKSQQREVRKPYLSGLQRRFSLTPSQLRSLFE